MAEYTGMTPTVVVGLGGTGKEVLIKVRRMIVETYGSLDALPIVSFLHIDTEQNAKVSETQVVLKQDISLRPVEQVWAKVEDCKPILNRLSDYEFLAEWFPAQLKGTDSILSGAGQIRALGKLAFTLNFQQIKEKFDAARTAIQGHEKLMLDKWQVQLDKGINIFVICSLSGGTGSGMFLDLAYNLRDWIPASQLPQTSAYLILPGAFQGLGDRVIANAFAALKELNHFSHPDSQFDYQYTRNLSDRITERNSHDIPFTFCYLTGNSNDKVTLPKLESVLEMVAKNVFLDFSSGFSQYKKLVRDNISKHWGSPDPLGFPQSFMSFGLASIEFPKERVLNACAYRLAKETVEWWANPTPLPTAMTDLIKTEILPSMNLSETTDLHQVLDSISLGENSKPYSKEVSDWISTLRKRRNEWNIPFENLPRFILVEQEKYAPHFNDSDPDPRRWSDYFQKMADNLETLKTQKRQALRDLITEMVEDRHRGPKFALRFLESVRDIFTFYSSEFDQKRQKEWIPKEKTAANAVQTITKQLEDHSKQFLLINRKQIIEEDFSAVLQSLEALYTSKVEVKARELGVKLIQILKEEVEILRTRLITFNQKLDTLKDYFAEKEKIYTEETRAITVNGMMIYDPSEIDASYQSLVAEGQEILFQAVSQDALTQCGIRLFQAGNSDPLTLKKIQDTLFYRCIDEFFGNTQLQTTVAQRFTQEYPTTESQEAQIRTIFEKSEVFLRFSQEQMRLGWDDRAEKRQKLIGIQGGTKPTDPAVSSLLPIIRKTSTLTDKDIRPLNSTHQIIFIHEVGAFPLRLIEGMDRMRTVYRNVAQNDRNPLHTHRDERQFPDLMPAPLSERKALSDLFLARALGFIQLKTNKITGFDEVRLIYKDPQTLLEKAEVLGRTWAEGCEFILSDDSRRVRDILEKSVRMMGQKANTREQKQVLFTQLTTYLEQIANSLIGGRDNPEYKQIEVTLEDFLHTYNLLPQTFAGSDSATNPSSPPPPSEVVPRQASTASSSIPVSEGNLGKFEKLVQTCYRRGTPSPTELQMLETFRVKYGISEVQAQKVIAKYAPNADDIRQQAVQEYGLMFRAFLENDGELDVQERAQLLDLQEELKLSEGDVELIENNLREELGL